MDGSARRFLALLATLTFALQGCGGDGSPTDDGEDDPCELSTTISLGQTRSGALTTTDCEIGAGGVAEEGTRIDRWELTLTEETFVRILLRSTAFDAVLFAFDEQSLFAFNDDFGGGPDGTDAEIRRTLPAGTYTIWVNNFFLDELGAYQLTVEEVEPGPCDIPTPIELGEVVDDALEEGDCVLVDGTFADIYEFTLNEAATVTILYQSVQFDAFLALLDEIGFTIDVDDDSGGGLNGTDARIEIALPAGTYQIFAISFFVGEVGTYQLTIE